MKAYLVIFAICIVLCFNIQVLANTTTDVYKAILLGVVNRDNKTFIQYLTPEDKINISEFGNSTEIIYKEEEVMLEDLAKLLADDEYSAWIWEYDNRVTKMMVAKNNYQIRIKAIDPALNRVLSTDGRWFNVARDVALNRLVAGELVDVYLSFDGSLNRILAVENSLSL